MNKKKLNLISPTVLVLLSVLLMPFFVQAAQSGTSNSDLTTITNNIYNTLVGMAGSIVIIGWVVAGILYLMAQGDPSKMDLAKKALIACVIGTILVALAMISSSAITEMINTALGSPSDL